MISFWVLKICFPSFLEGLTIEFLQVCTPGYQDGWPYKCLLPSDSHLQNSGMLWLCYQISSLSSMIIIFLFSLPKNTQICFRNNFHFFCLGCHVWSLYDTRGSRNNTKPILLDTVSSHSSYKCYHNGSNCSVFS